MLQEFIDIDRKKNPTETLCVTYFISGIVKADNDHKVIKFYDLLGFYSK